MAASGTATFKELNSKPSREKVLSGYKFQLKRSIRTGLVDAHYPTAEGPNVAIISLYHSLSSRFL